MQTHMDNISKSSLEEAEIIIREYTDKDTDNIRKHIDECMELYLDRKPCIHPDIENMKEIYGKNFWVAIQNGKIVGTLGVSKNQGEEPDLRRFYVKEGYGNKGIGRRLYEMAEKSVTDNDENELYAFCGKVLKTAHMVYQKLGFECVRSTEEDLIFMKKLK